MTFSLASKSPAPILLASLFLISILFSAYSVSGLASANPDVIYVAPGQTVSGEIVIDANERVELSFQAPKSIPNWVVSQKSSPNTMEVMMVVNATSNWQISVSANANTGGKMAEYNTATFQYISGGKTLKTPMKIKAENGNEVDLSEGGVLVEGSGNQAIPVTFEQVITKEDEPLPKGYIYNIQLHFNVSPL